MNENGYFRFDLWLYNELRKRGMKQIDLAEKSGVSISAVHYLLRNKQQPTMRTLGMILNALDMHMEFVSN